MMYFAVGKVKGAVAVNGDGPQGPLRNEKPRGIADNKRDSLSSASIS